MDLRTSINRLRTIFFISYLCIAGIALAAFCIMSEIHHDKLAKVLAMSVHNSLVIHDLRQAMVTLNSAVGANFERIEYRVGEQLVFSLPSQLTSSSKGWLTSTYIEDLNTEDSPNEDLGEIIFYSSFFEPVVFGAIVWLVLLILAFPLFRYSRTALESRHNDIVRQKSAETALRIAEQVAHDVRSPLSALNIVSASSSGLSDEQQALLTRATRRITEICTDLLSKHKTVVNSAPILIADVIKDIIEEKNLSGHQGSIHFADPKLNISVRVDRSGLTRVISNLLQNASEAGDKIKISIRENEQSAEIQIEDNGPGIPDDIFQKLGSRGFTTKQGGHGLGLAGAIEQVHSWGGEIKIERVTPHGTRVRIILQS